MSAAPQQPLTLPCRLWELQAVPSAASVGSVANTFTSCSGTWLMGGSTTEAASGMIFQTPHVWVLASVFHWGQYLYPPLMLALSFRHTDSISLVVSTLCVGFYLFIFTL